MQKTPYHQANQAIQKLTKEFAEMWSEVLSSVNALTEAYADIFTNISNNDDSPHLTSSSQLSSISNPLSKVEGANNLSNNKDDLFNLTL